MVRCNLSIVVLFLLTPLAEVAGQPAAKWWSDNVEQALVKAKANRAELEGALQGVPEEQRKGMAFLIANMPESDLTSLTSEFLRTNADLAYKARRETPWGKRIPEAIFLNDVLPYANIDEKRDPWRQEFYDLCMPIVQGCKTPSDAAQKLNTELFKKINLRYAPQTKAPNFSPKESMAQKTASCTGLSIVLSDACRAVGVPARLVGTPNWSDKRGNHTWIEIWDDDWHFTGACEPDPKGLDRGWFVADAAKAQKDSLEHAIFAASFRKTNQYFPLVWARGKKTISSENVTDRYTQADAAKSASVLKALDAALDNQPAALAELATMELARVPLTKADAQSARKRLWDWHAAFIRNQRAKEIADKVLKEDKLEMPFEFKTFGEKPKGGRSLWISMHGGGKAAKQVNDSQWRNQITLYKLDEGIYLAPRAPTNTWNLWHEGHIDRLFARLIEDLIVLEEVNPDRVYLMGYSAGGDGVYQLAPRMADTWAGAAMMAGHPNGVSLLSLRNVPFALQVGGKDAAYNRNKVGREYGELLGKLQKDDPKGYPHFVKIHEDKPHWMGLEDKAALPWMAKFTRNPIPERIVWKQTGTLHERSYWLAVPQGDPKADALVIAERDGQTIEIKTTEKVKKLLIRLDDRMADLDQAVVVKHAGKELYRGAVSRTIGAIVRTLSGRGDPSLVFDAEVAVELKDSE
jgi:predicted peptidase